MGEKEYVYSKEVVQVLEDSGVGKSYALAQRLFEFAVEVIKATRTLPRSKEYSVITYQLVKSTSSIGANYEEAQGAVSKADFSNKVGICLKESRETTYWIRLIIEVLDENKTWKSLKQEATELQNILGSIYSKVSVRR